MPELILSSEGTPVLRCPLRGQILRVGRSPTNDIALPDLDGPPLLCSFEPVAGGAYRVVDRGGAGLQVAGLKVDERVLQEGDEITLGRLCAHFRGGQLKSAPATQVLQRTGVLKRNTDGSLTHVQLRVQLPKSAGGEALPIGDSGLRLGSGEDNDVVLTEGFVSTFHAQLFWRGERLFVRDLDSTNGTFVDGVQVVEAEVPAGATLMLGQLELPILAEEQREETPQKEGQGPWQCGDMVTVDPEFASSFALIEKVARHDATVCVFGETGTGKELVARALHDLGGRKRGPFEPLNCAAIPEHLIESHLFGHERGAFTGADRMRKGAFEEANKGTLFLDEIGELPLEAQAKLLRVLETRKVRRLGASVDLPVDVRIVTATHRDLMAEVAEGRFREDLLHRLYVIPLQLPPLRKRAGDAVFLARHFAKQLHPKGNDVEVTSDAAKALQTHPFPGNVRELRNVIQRALIFGDGHRITGDNVQFIPTSITDLTDEAQVYRPGMTMEDVEREAYRNALDAFDSAAEAARSLGLPKTTFWRRATSLGLLKK